MVHAIHHFWRVTALCEVGLDRYDDRGDKRENVAGANVFQRVAVVRFVLFDPVVAQSDLVLVIEPGLVVIGARCIEDSLPKPFANGLGIFGVDLMAVRILVVGAEVRQVENDPTPGIQKVLDVVPQQVLRQPQMDDVFFGE